MNGKINEDLSVLIIGFDGYKDVWDRDISLMNKYWADRPKTYLVDSELSVEYENVTVINAGHGSEWSKKVQVGLDSIDTRYVLLMLEDFFITDYVDNSCIDEALSLIKTDGIKFYQVLVQLLCSKWEKGKAYRGKKYLKIIPEDKKYGINLQAAIWEKDFLRDMVGEGNYNAWVFEIEKLKITGLNHDKIEYLIDDRNILKITHSVVQSKYLRGAKKKLKRLGVVIPESERPQLTRKEDFKYNFKLLMFSLTPRFLVKPFKSIGRLLKVDFVTDRIKAK